MHVSVMLEVHSDRSTCLMIKTNIGPTVMCSVSVNRKSRSDTSFAEPKMACPAITNHTGY